MKKIFGWVALFGLLFVPALSQAHEATSTVVRSVVPVPKVSVTSQTVAPEQASTKLFVLKVGVKDPAVGLLQGFLTNNGYDTKGIDNSFGPNTASALRQFQSSQGLAADGVAGPATMRAIAAFEPASTNTTAVNSNQTPTNNQTLANLQAIPNLPYGVLSEVLVAPALALEQSIPVRVVTAKPRTTNRTFTNIGIYVSAGGSSSVANGSGLDKNYSSGNGVANSKYICAFDENGVKNCFSVDNATAEQIKNGEISAEDVLANRSGSSASGECPSFYVDENGNPGVTDDSWWGDECGSQGSTSGSNQNTLAVSGYDKVCLEGKVFNTRNSLPTGELCPNGLTVENQETDPNRYLGVVKVQESDRGLVKEVQNALVALNYNITPDGVFGSQTKSVVMEVQRKNNLTQDGIVGRATFEALQNELNQKSPGVSLLNNVLKIRDTAYELESKNFIVNANNQFNFNKSSTWGSKVIDSPDSQWYMKSAGVDSRGNPRTLFVHTHRSSSVSQTSNSSNSALAQAQSLQAAQAVQLTPNPIDSTANETASDIGGVYCRRISRTDVGAGIYSVRVYIGTDKTFWVQSANSSVSTTYQIPGKNGPFPQLKLLAGSTKNALYFSYTTQASDNIPVDSYPSLFTTENSNIILQMLGAGNIFTLSPDGKKYYSFDWSALNDANLPTCVLPSYGDGFIGVYGPNGVVGGYNPSNINPVVPQCTDGIDNDGDGKTDYPADPGCSYLLDTTENSDAPNAPPPPSGGDGTCTDGIKNGNETGIDIGGSCEGGILSPGTNHQQPVIGHIYGVGKPVLVNWKDINLPDSWAPYLEQSKKDWNLSRKILISIDGAGHEVPMYYRDDYKEDDGSPAQWIGAYFQAVSGGHQTGSVGFNKQKMDELNLNTPEYIQFLVCHELGHSIGMGHSDVNNNNANLGTCSDYSRQPGGGGQYGTLDNLHPSSIDIEAINLLYQHNH